MTLRHPSSASAPRRTGFTAWCRTGLIAAALLASHCAGATPFPITVTDDRGEQVAIDKPPRSVAAISTFGADVLQALGRQASGVSRLQQRPSRFLGQQVLDAVNLGEVHEPDMEQLTRLAPDLIVGLQQYAEPFAGQFQKIAPLLTFDLITYEDSNRAVARTALALGQGDEGLKLNHEFDAMLRQYHGKAPGEVSVVFLWHWADTLFGFYDHHVTTHIIKQLRADYPMGQSPTPEMKKPDAGIVSMEKLLALNPDVIISFTGDDRPVSYHPVWSKLKAVKAQRAFRVSDQYIMAHGPIARSMVLRELANLLYPDTFATPTDIPEAAQAKPLTFLAQ